MKITGFALASGSILPNNEQEWTRLNTMAWFVNLANNCNETDERDLTVSGSVRQLICRAYLEHFNSIRLAMAKQSLKQ